MTAPNHIIGGFTFTGVFASIAGINILQDYRLLPVILIASLLPDIDHTKSIIGKCFYPIAKAINRKYGHRTITHSLIVLIALTALVSAFQAAYFPDIKIAQVFGLAYGSHILFDMMTIQGVPLFYPFKKNPCVLPGNPEMRIRTSSIRQESMVFCVFMTTAVFLQPLFANGFWTSYNSLFGTLKHIVSEYNKSKDLIIVDFTLQHGSELTQHKGLCVAVNTSKITIITKKKQFESYPKEGQQITNITPTHTKMKHTFRQGDLIDISADSLMRFVAAHKCTKLDMQASTKFYVVENTIETKKSKLSLSYPNQLYIKEIPQENKAQYVTSPGIASSRDQIALLQAQYNKAYSQYQQELDQYQALRSKMETTTAYVAKQMLMEQLDATKEPTPPKSIEDKILDYKLRIKSYEQEDRLRYQTALGKQVHIPLTFTGTYEKLLINGKDI